MRKSTKVLLIIAVILLIIVVAAVVAVKMLFLFPGGQPVLRTREVLDLRGTALTPEEYAQLSQEMPDCRILWSIPIGGETYDSTSTHITLNSLREADTALFGLFEDLQMVDARGCEDYDALLKLEALLPECDMQWGIHLGGNVLPVEETALDLQGAAVTGAELLEKLSYFPGLEQAVLTDVSLTPEEHTALREAFPEVAFVWNVEAAGKTWLNTDAALSYAGETVDVQALIDAAPRFDAVAEIDLSGCGVSAAEIAALRDAFGGAFVRSEIAVCGKNFTTDMTEIDLSGIQMEDTAEVEQAVACMPFLEKVIMSDCGFTNEEMDALNQRYADVLFVWTVRFSVYELRTDAVAFCASDLPSNGYIAMKLNSQQLEPLKYCTELVALDLGHMHYDDLSFLENMTKLRYLILVEARYQDISILASLPELYYLELFNNTIPDLSPLLECRNLRHLNVGYTRANHTDVLKQMTWLERMWCPGNSMTQEEKAAITEALPNTEVYMPSYDTDGSTGGGWREADVYFEMRNYFGMFYQPGGTGTDQLKGN